jgi:xanthine/uracil/vitamin C permease (AzgA family)
MGHNVVFLLYCRDGTVNWQTGLGAICISGLAFLVMAFWGVRAKIVHAIPDSLKHAIAVGIGLLIAFLGFQWAGLAVDHPDLLVTLGDLGRPPVLLALGGLLLTSALIALRLKGAILVGILATAAAGVPLGITPTDELKTGVFKTPEPAERQALALLAPSEPEHDAVTAAAGALESASERYNEDFSSVKKMTLPPGEGDERLRAAREQFEFDLAVVPSVERRGDKDILVARAYRYSPPEKPDGSASFELWREYPPVPAGVSGKRLQSYADDVLLGLPGHEGLLRLDILGALKWGMLHVIFIFFFLDLFDTIGTLVGVSEQAGLLRDGKLPRARQALLSDAVGTVVGAGLGTSTVTSYIESTAGVAEGGRTGLANMVTAALFVAALFFSPVVKMVGQTNQAVAPVLIIVGSIMMSSVTRIRWRDATEALPAFLAIMVMPLAFSITDGIAFGFISYVFLKTVSGRWREVHWLMYLFAALFVVRYVVKFTIAGG